MRAVWIVARKEFRDGMRNRWALAIALVFGLLAVGIAYFGPAASGASGFASLAATQASLDSLAAFLIPLIALLLAYDAMVGEQEQGTLLLLLSYPLSRVELLMGKFLGDGAILALATAMGFGAAAGLINLLTHPVGSLVLWRAFGFFIVSATLLGLSFIAIAYLISVSVTERARAAGLALIAWFVFVLMFDMGLLGLLVATKGAVGRAVFPYLLLLNPTDVFRVANLTGLDSGHTYVGMADAVAGHHFSQAWLVAVLVLWVAVPLGAAAWRFHRWEP